MKNLIKLFQASSLVACCLLTACATKIPEPKDLTAYRQNMPKSILVLPPVNNSPDVRATHGYLSTTTQPIAEAGYYVFPIALVDQTFKDNGLANAAEIQQVSPKKLHEIFGADAAMYIAIKEYGTKYQVIQSVTSVEADAKLVDLNTGSTLWQGNARQVVPSNQSGGGVIGLMVNALINQVVNHSIDFGHNVSASVNQQMFQPNAVVGNALLFGPRSPNFKKDGVAK